MTDRLRRSAACALFSVCVLAGMRDAQADQPATGPAPSSGFSADVVVERTTVDRDGVVVSTDAEGALPRHRAPRASRRLYRDRRFRTHHPSQAADR